MRTALVTTLVLALAALPALAADDPPPTPPSPPPAGPAQAPAAQPPAPIAPPPAEPPAGSYFDSTTVTATGAIVPNGTHIDGQVQAVASCTGCHGDAARLTGEANKPAPPVDLGGSQASDRVGAHQAHLGTDVQCTDCHVVPAVSWRRSSSTVSFQPSLARW